ncbi:hypothetical protein D3C78_1666270 [compost metagenome]
MVALILQRLLIHHPPRLVLGRADPVQGLRRHGLRIERSRAISTLFDQLIHACQ